LAWFGFLAAGDEMISRIRNALMRLVMYISFLGILMTSCENVRVVDTISGRVLDEQGPVAGAVVRVQTTENSTVADVNGMFTLSGLDADSTVTVTAWKSGYYIAGVQEVVPGTDGVEIHLEAHADSDNPDYAWLPSHYYPGQGEGQGCAECHSNMKTEISFALPVDEWLLDAHSQSAINPRFLSMYSGSDLEGHKSPDTRYATSKDYGTFPLLPDPTQLYYGPGYKLDFPETEGNCAACHTPAASVNDPYGVDPMGVSGVAAEGVSCDFCHKIWDVKLDPTSGLPYPNMPGVLSYEFRRPPEGHQFFAGPLDDVAPGEDTYSALQTQSQFCAPCHFGVFWDSVIYNSFGEWLESPYSDPESGQSCQDCHMPPLGVTHFALLEAGGQERDSSTIFSHRMPGASDEELLQNAVSMAVEAQREGEKIIVEVNVTNDQTGHHIPTDSPLRHLILLVKVSSPDGELLTQTEGATIPDYGGVGNSARGYYSGLPGKIYAKVLIELWTEISPSGAYWNPTRIVSDNRLAALETDSTTYVFAAPQNGEVTVRTSLLFRRAFIELMDQKGWDIPDIVMEVDTNTVP
jgi:hypothetical protein